MAKLKYKDKDGFWQELLVGTNVVANPMLTGTEQELTSLQVGNAKYKSGGGKLYRHFLEITLDNDYHFYTTFYKSNNAFITFDELPNIVIGAINNMNGVVYFEKSGGSAVLSGVGAENGTTPIYLYENSHDINSIIDTVIEV